LSFGELSDLVARRLIVYEQLQFDVLSLSWLDVSSVPRTSLSNLLGGALSSAVKKK